MGGANQTGYVVSTPEQAQDAKAQGHWFLDPRHLPVNTSQEIGKAGRRPGAHEEAEPTAEPAVEPAAEPATGPITIPISLPKPTAAEPAAEIVAWFEHSVVVGGVAFSPIKDWTVEAIAAAGCTVSQFTSKSPQQITRSI
jgi:hypothetical protein